jgi:hypothetical protein
MPVHLDGAGPALRGAASDVPAGQSDVLAQEVDEQQSRLDVGRDSLSVDAECDCVRCHFVKPAYVVGQAEASPSRIRPIAHRVRVPGRTELISTFPAFNNRRGQSFDREGQCAPCGPIGAKILSPALQTRPPGGSKYAAGLRR